MPIKLAAPHTFNWSACTKPEKWAVIYKCDRSIHFTSLYDFLFWNCTDSVVVCFLNFSRKQELLTLHEYLGSPPVFDGVCVAHLFSFQCYVFLLCLSSSCVLCTQCCQFLWIVHSWLPLRFSLTFIAYSGLWLSVIRHIVPTLSTINSFTCRNLNIRPSHDFQSESWLR